MFAVYTRHTATPFLLILFAIFLISIFEACGGTNRRIGDQPNHSGGQSNCYADP